MMHKVLIEPEKHSSIKNGELKHHLIHKSYNVAKGDVIFFRTNDATKGIVQARATYIDNDMPGFNNNHFIFSFELI